MHGCGFPTAVSDALTVQRRRVYRGRGGYPRRDDQRGRAAGQADRTPREIVAKKNGAHYSEAFEFRCGCMPAPSTTPETQAM